MFIAIYNESGVVLVLLNNSLLTGRTMLRRLFILPLLASTALMALPASADDFSDTIAYAYATHPDLKAAEENLEAVRDTVWEAHGGYQPTITANYERGRKRFQFDGADQKYVNTMNKQLTVSQPVFRGGGTVAQIRTARAQTRAEEARFFGVGQEVLLNSITAYARVFEAEKILQINRDNVDRLEQHMGATRTRRQANDLTVTDVALSEARLARAESNLRDAEGNYDSARAVFFREIGRQPDVTELPPIPAALPDSEEKVAELAKHHPNMTIAQEQEKAADSTIDARFSTLLPSVTLNGKMEDQEGISTLSSSLTNLREDSITLRVSIPLYQSGAEYARLSQSRHRYRKARNDTFDTVRDTRKNAVNTWHDYTAAKGSVESYNRAFDAAERAFSGIGEEYKYGARTVLDVLDTQQELFAAQQALIRAETREVIEAYRLLAAVGRLDPKHLKLNVKKYENEAEPSQVASTSGKMAAVPASSRPALAMPEDNAQDLTTPADMANAEMPGEVAAAERPIRFDLTVPPGAPKDDPMYGIEPAAGEAPKKAKTIADTKQKILKEAPVRSKLAAPEEIPVETEASETLTAERDEMTLPSIARRKSR